MMTAETSGAPNGAPLATRPDLGWVDRIAGRIEFVFVAVSGLIALVLVLLVTFDVIMRSVFNAPIQNSYEFMALGMVPIVYLGLAHVQARGENVAIESATNWLPPKGRATLELLGCFVGLGMMAAITSWGAEAAWHTFETGEYLGSVSRVVVWPFRTLLVVGATMLTLRLAIEIVRTGCLSPVPPAQRTRIASDTLSPDCRSATR